jgi:hypothetical protein
MATVSLTSQFGAHLETVKPSPAYWTLKLMIGTAVPDAFGMASSGSRIEPAHPK